MDILFKTYFGSKLYGLQTPESDEDIRGVFLAPAREFLGLGGVKENIDGEGEDESYHEIAKFLNLCLKNSLPALEVLYTPDEFVIEMDPAFQWLRERKDAFLNATFKHCYKGMVHQNLMRAEKETTKTGKFLCHALRICLTAQWVFNEGTFSPVPLQHSRDILYGVKTGEIPSSVARLMVDEELEETLELGEQSDLPDVAPIRDAVDDWLIQLRLEKYEKSR